ncbi:MAG: sulfite exporter TauE/SafE family protein [Pirellulales bacterium]|nr:sulfite exporter TauE/SafE family protein [Pirellulales bacterium]
MSSPHSLLLALLIFGAALLYSTVGHGGASAYLAVMALLGTTPEVMKPTALVLNILVAGLATVKFYRAGYFSWSLFWPFALASVPLAFVGGAITLPVGSYRAVVGAVLLFAATRLLVLGRRDLQQTVRRPPLLVALGTGAGIGLLSGLTGVGGGIFLSPLLLLVGWAETRETSGVSAPFIVVNSAAGLLGHVTSVAQVPFEATYWGAAAVLGGWLGAHLGSQKLDAVWLRRLLGVVLVLAGLKLILT